MRARVSFKRYARALVEVAAESGELGHFGKELSTFAEILKSQGLRAFFQNPGVLFREKRWVFETLTGQAGLGPLAKASLHLLLERGELLQLDGIVRAYEELKDERLGRLKGAVTSAVPLSDKEAEKLQERLEQVTGKTVSLERKVDPSFVGGLIVQLKSNVYDGSLKTRLLRMKEHLLKT